ncbi:hypothetical protein BACCAP_02273 [Pseudoflavonifractor capillosus ATCC 29799]|uniref:Uncharacterized protein n=1 Tax=Pseudoflavonifractor capillosus ATCC 29799 TaxID=411467 RepID=A6NVN0_9FIRM|nr:hypothetical protein BACCAP_02273 [Pseudoflavonifractor capillosus ATCC 29799]
MPDFSLTDGFLRTERFFTQVFFKILQKTIDRYRG